MTAPVNIASIVPPGVNATPPVPARYRVDFNGNTLCLFDVDEKGGYTVDIVDPALYAIFPKSRFSELPASIHNMHPDHGMFGSLLQIKTKTELIGTGLKGLSGIRIFPVDKETGKVPVRGHRLDFVRDDLYSCSDDENLFMGNYTGPVGLAGTPEFESVLRDQWVGRFNHRFSGKQTKIPTCLLPKGIFVPAVDRLPFSHFYKLPSVGGREADGLLEWAGLRMARAAGLSVNEFALINQGEKFPPAIVVERFDIAKSAVELEKEWILMQDFYSITGEDPMHEGSSAKPLFRYDDLLGGLINFCRKHDPESTGRNAESFLRRLFVSWAGNDADLHAKNMSVLMRIDPQNKTVRSVEFAPAYDVCLSTMSGSDGEPMFYNLTGPKRGMEGKPPRKLNMNDFINFLQSKKISVDGKPFCIFDTRDEAEEFIRDIASKVAYSAVESWKKMPDFISENKYAGTLEMEMQHMASIAVKRAKSIGADTPPVDFDPELNKLVKEYGAKSRKKANERGAGGISALYTQLARDAEENGRKLLIQKPPAAPAVRHLAVAQ